MRIFINISLQLTLQWDRTGSGDGLTPHRHQDIIWTNVFLVYWRIYAFLDLDEDNDPFIEYKVHKYHVCWCPGRHKN